MRRRKSKRRFIAYMVISAILVYCWATAYAIYK